MRKKIKIEANSSILKIACLELYFFQLQNRFFPPKSFSFHFLHTFGAQKTISNILFSCHKSWKSLET